MDEGLLLDGAHAHADQPLLFRREPDRRRREVRGFLDGVLGPPRSGRRVSSRRPGSRAPSDPEAEIERCDEKDQDAGQDKKPGFVHVRSSQFRCHRASIENLAVVVFPARVILTAMIQGPAMMSFIFSRYFPSFNPASTL